LPLQTRPFTRRASSGRKCLKEAYEGESIHGGTDHRDTEEVEAGMKAADVCREQGISEATFYKWKAKYGGLEVSEARRLKRLEEENAKLKRIVADLTVDNVVLKDLLSKNVWSAAGLQGKSGNDKVVRENVSGL
jgi:putative transposase